VQRRRITGLHVYTALVLAFLFLPVAVVALYAFHSSAALGLPFKGVSLRWFRQVLHDPQMHHAIWNSLQISLVAAAVVAVVGTMAAVATTKYRFKGRSFANVAIILPIALPALLYAISLLSFYSRHGITLSLWTATLGHIVLLLPVFYVIVSTRLNRFDPLLEEAARDLGATAFQSFRRVVLPAIAPAIFGGILLTIASSWDEFIVSLFNIGVDVTVPLLLYTRIKVAILPSVNVIAVLLLAATAIVMISARRLTKELNI
jgi:ABC-type spermidine/putrescine transport system permease subunit II